MLAVEATVTVGVPRDEVWHAISDGHTRRRWWAYMDVDTRLGGHFEEHWADGRGRQMLTFGHVLDVIPGRFLRLSWTDEHWPEPTTVEIRLHDADGGTAVVVHHSGWERLPAGERLAADHLDGWHMHLDNLRAFLEQCSGQ